MSHAVSAISSPQDSEYYAQRAMQHVQYLAETIGPRPSTGEGERLAAQYFAGLLREIGLQNVRLESFQSGHSTYQPYLLAFGAAMLGSAVYHKRPRRSTALLAAVANAAAAIGFAREASLQDNWLRRVLPTGQSQNVIGVVPARKAVLRRVVVYGHLDSHRTPIVYSDPLWLKLFSSLVALGFGSLLVGVSTHAVASVKPKMDKSKWLRTAHICSAGVQGLCLGLLAQAESTPYSPGANDNASGAATVLALAERLANNPLVNTEVWFVGTGCEEVGCYGMSALLDAHERALRDAFFLDFDMVGIGAPSLLTREGLLKASFPDEVLLNAAREVANQNPDLIGGEHAGGAYTETSMVTLKGFRGVTIDSVRPPDHPAEARMGYWHQMQDTADHIEIECLKRTHEFGWKLLQYLDQEVHTSSQS